MKARGLASPDDADALALTFAEPVMPLMITTWVHPSRQEWRRVEEEENLYRDLDTDDDLYRDLREED
jgi:hypothetical protein